VYIDTRHSHVSWDLGRFITINSWYSLFCTSTGTVEYLSLTEYHLSYRYSVLDVIRM
jgi:hypothetical protein